MQVAKGGTSGELVGRWTLFEQTDANAVRSASARAALEAVFAPRALLPERGDAWRAENDDHIMASAALPNVIAQRWPEVTKGTFAYLAFGATCGSGKGIAARHGFDPTDSPAAFASTVAARHRHFRSGATGGPRDAEAPRSRSFLRHWGWSGRRGLGKGNCAAAGVLGDHVRAASRDPRLSLVCSLVAERQHVHALSVGRRAHEREHGRIPRNIARGLSPLLGALWDQDHLADVAPLGDEAVGIGRAVKRERRVRRTGLREYELPRSGLAIGSRLPLCAGGARRAASCST